MTYLIIGKLVLQHATYRLLRFLLLHLQYFWFTLKRVFTMSNGNRLQRPLEIGHIVYRYKHSMVGIASEYDFVWRHDRYQEEDILTDPHWSLYSLDKNRVHFVYLPKEEKFYNSLSAPFLYMEQYKNALKITSMDFNRFVEFKERSLKQIQCNIVFVNSVARSGSTLVAKMLQCSDKITVYSEPDYFSLLTIYANNGYFPNQLCDQLISTGLQYICRNLHTDETLIVKPRGVVVQLVPFMERAMPKIVKYVYVFRKDFRKIITSINKVFASHGEARLQIQTISKRLSTWMFSEFSGIYPQLWKAFPPETNMDQAILLYITSYVVYCQNRKYFSLPWILYEDLIKDPAETLRPLFDLCKLPTESLAHAVKMLNQDSQSGTVLSRSRMDAVKVDQTMTQENLKLISRICATFDVPDIFNN